MMAWNFLGFPIAMCLNNPQQQHGGDQQPQEDEANDIEAGVMVDEHMGTGLQAAPQIENEDDDVDIETETMSETSGRMGPAVLVAPDPLVPKNQLDSTFLYEEEAFLCEQGLDIRSPEKIDEYSINRDLRDETPPEIQRASEEISIQTVNEDILSSDLHLQLRLDTCCKKLKWDEQCDDILNSPAQLHEHSTSPASKSQSYKSKEYEKSGKFVRFEEVKNVYVDEPGKHFTALDISPSQNDSQQQLDTSNSPYPTPLNLTDEMQPDPIWNRMTGTWQPYFSN